MNCFNAPECSIKFIYGGSLTYQVTLAVALGAVRALTLAPEHMLA